MRIVMALALLLMALSPMAPAAAAQQATTASAFSDAPHAPCDSTDAVCAEFCQPASPLALKYVAVPVLAPVAVDLEARDIVFAAPPVVLKPTFSLARAGPPAYLRFHSLLL
jgi:hypothetical protein